jgi:hypothetical protein
LKAPHIQKISSLDDLSDLNNLRKVKKVSGLGDKCSPPTPPNPHQTSPNGHAPNPPQVPFHSRILGHKEPPHEAGHHRWLRIR